MVDGGCAKSKLKYNFKFCTYYKKNGHLIEDYHKLQNKEKLVANQQSKTLQEVNISKNYHNNEELLFIYEYDSKHDEDWIFHTTYTFNMCPNRNSFFSI